MRPIPTTNVPASTVMCSSPGCQCGGIFAPFGRAASVEHYGGLGLGLWLSQQIVAASGGAIRVESAPGEGSTFSVELPREPQP